MRLPGFILILATFLLASCQPASRPTQAAPVSAASAAAVVSAPSVLTLHTVTNATQRQAVCNDGTPAVYYYRPGSGAEASHWLIFFQGGGWCASDSTCANRWKTQHYLMTSQGAPSTLTAAGIFTPAEQQNPDFAAFTQVYIRYCSSDMYSGNGTRQTNSLNLQFRGHAIVAAILEDLQNPSLIPSPNLKNATDVLLGGSSAGSFGAASNVDWVASQLPWAHVKGVLDSSWVAPGPNYGSGPAGPQPGSADFFNYITGVSDGSCAAANPSQPYICLSTLQLYPYISTPVFVYADQRDPTLLETKGLFNSTDPAAASYVSQYSASLRQSLQHVTAVFSPSAGIHTALTSNNFFDIKINGQNFAGLLGNWYYDRPGALRLIAGQTP